METNNNMPMLNKEAFKQRVERLSNLPTLPNLLQKFTEMVKDPKASMAAFGKELSKDQVITSKLLKLVNSAFYGFPGRIGTITHALVLLGYDAVKGLIVSSNIFESLPKEAYPLWRHSIAVSLASRAIAKELSLIDVEEITVAGLLHDIGKVVLHLEAPEEYAKAIEYATEHQKQMHDVERELFGFDHAQIGAWLCEKWNLPDKLALPIGEHHAFKNTQEHQVRIAVISFADTLIKGIGGSAEKNLPLENLPNFVETQIPLTLVQIRKLVQQLEPEVESLKYLCPEDMKK